MVFKSQYHPENLSKGLVYTKSLIKPIGACVAPLMIGATAAALKGQPVWGYLVWGFPSALLLATLWTHFRLSTTPAELYLRAGKVAVRSVQDVMLDRAPSWNPLYNVRVSSGQTEISVGWNTRICRRSEWPQYQQLREAAQKAFDPIPSSASSSSPRV